MNAKEIFLKLVGSAEHLTEEEAAVLIEGVVRGEFAPVQVAALLTALRVKGETPEEIVGCIRTMRKHMLTLSAPGAVDLAGTGGDGAGTFNISTAASFVVAGAGAGVAKHGNRAASSKCGSADVLEALGVNIMLAPREAEAVFSKVGMVFLFAPIYHPAMKNIGPVRKELGFRTVFNFLGPFLNPAGTKRQLIGVPDRASAEKLAVVAVKLGFEHILIVTSEDGMDEITTTAKTMAFEVKSTSMCTFMITPEEFGIALCKKDALLGGDAMTNAEIIRNILAGEKSPRRDIVVLNAAAALFVSGTVRTIAEGVTLAERSIDSGAAQKALTNLIAETTTYAQKT